MAGTGLEVREMAQLVNAVEWPYNPRAGQTGTEGSLGHVGESV